jgi:tRNA-specific 2-thiouridylase
MSARVVLAMSGGVDSSAAAHLLLEEGYEVIGLFMRSGATEESSVTCALADNPAASKSVSTHSTANAVSEISNLKSEIPNLQLAIRPGAPGHSELPIVHPKSHKQGCCSASDAADARRGRLARHPISRAELSRCLRQN